MRRPREPAIRKTSSVIPFDRTSAAHGPRPRGRGRGARSGRGVLGDRRALGPPGVGPRVHRHPYPEAFVVESGEATFRLGDRRRSSSAAGTWWWSPSPLRRFVNSGERGSCGWSRSTARLGSSTEWLEGVDPAWATRPPVEGGSELRALVTRGSSRATRSAAPPRQGAPLRCRWRRISGGGVDVRPSSLGSRRWRPRSARRRLFDGLDRDPGGLPRRNCEPERQRVVVRDVVDDVLLEPVRRARPGR